jgi:hypothetical protein
MIIYSLFSKRGSFWGLETSKYLKRHPSQLSSGVDTTVATALARGELARRALTVRVMGYIITPAICAFPTIAIDLMSRARLGVPTPQTPRLIGAITAGLMGAFNSIIFSFDPSVVAVVFWPYWKKRREQRMQKRNKSPQQRLDHLTLASIRKPSVLEDPETGNSMTSERETQNVVISSFHPDHGLEFYGHLEVRETPDFDTSFSSTIGYDTDELAQIFHGL